MSNIDKHIDKQALREAAATAKIAGEAPVMPFDQRITALNDFMKQCTPATVLALLDELEAKDKRIAELERKEQHSERQSVIDALAGSGEEWSDIEEYMQKWDAERAAAAGKGERA